MQYSIEQLATASDPIKLDRMIPIFIGKSKTLISESPKFLNNAQTLIQLNNDNTSIIDKETINASITYWKSLTYEIDLDDSSNTTKNIELNVPITEKFNKNSIFIIYDINNVILFSSTIEKFIYDANFLLSIELTNNITITGDIKCKLICKTKENINYTYDSLNKQISLNYDNKFNLPIVSGVISYNIIPSNCIITIYENITETDITNESNENIKIGLKNCKSAIVVSISNDNLILEALDKISMYRVGYYIVPIELSNNAIKAIAAYSKKSDMDFYGAVIPSELITSKILVSNVIVTRPSD